MDKKYIIAPLVLITIIGWGGYRLLMNDHFQLFGELVFRVDTNEKVVALTFDDGPTPKRTQQILKILEQEKTKATFYLVGRSMQKHPVEAALLVNSGHEIGNHSFSHSRMVFMPYSTVANELETTTELIKQHGYTAPIHFRPPYGKKLFNLPRYLSNEGIKTITWDVEPETWDGRQIGVEGRVKRAIERTKPGSIILLHVMHGTDESMRSVTPIIQKLKAQGYRFVTVSELLALGDKNSD